MAKKHTASKQVLAEIHGVSQVTISNWMRKGLPVLAKDSQGRAALYDVPATISWRIAQEVSRLTSNPTSGEVLDKNAEEARLRKFQADKAEVEALKARQEAILVEDVKPILFEIAAIYAARLDALGGRLANELAATTEAAEVRKLLFEETRRVRAETADALADFAVQGNWSIGGDSEGEPAEDGGPVG